MRNERKRKRSFLARFMVFMMIINLLSGVNPSVVRADESSTKNYKNYSEVEGQNENEGIVINKEVLSEDTDGTFEIKLSVKGAEKITKKNKKTDIVLVVDTSGSMREPKVGDNYTNIRINNAKEAATSFVKAMIKESGKGDIKIGLVSFASGAEKKSNLTNDKDSLNRVIQTLTADGGTYTQAGLNLANEILRGGDAEEKIIVLISDGKPTFADGTHPNFGKRGENGYTRIDKYLVKTGYEIWHGETSGINGKWIGKGYDYSGEYGNYIVKLVTGKFGDGTESHHGQGAKSWPYNLMGDYFRNATISAADKIKNDKVKIYSVGIGLKEETADDEETKKDKELGRDVLEGIANNGNYLDAGAQAEGLNKILESLAVEIHHNKVINGTIVDPMSNYVEYVDSSAKITDSKNAKLEVPSNNNNNTLKISNINLGKDEKLEVVYKVKLKDNWKDGEFHPANGETTLTPNSNAEPMNFKVPEVRADEEKVTLTVNKTWIGEAPVASVTFNIKADNGTPNDTVVVRADNNGNWTGKRDNLPKYKDGKVIQYTVEEVPGNNYELKGDINSKADKDGNITFTATNQNTEKVNITVTKKWVKTPDEYKDDINVVIYSRAEGETEFKEGESKTLSKSDEDKKKTLFTNLPKYNEAGKLIEYKVEEEGTDKEGKLKIGDNSFKVDVIPTEGNNYDWTITNTCDPIEKNIKFTLVKKWDKKPDENVKATFNLIAKVNNKEIGRTKIVLPVESQGEDRSKNTEITDNGKTWTTVIEPYKYDSDNNLIEYTIEEEKLNAYASDPAGEVKVVDGKTITFYNTRIMRTLTLEKKWVGNPGNQAEFTLSGNDEETITLNKGNEWSAKIGLPVYDLINGKKIEYTITEKDIKGYEAVEKTQKFTFPEDGSKIGNKTITFTNRELHKDKFTVNKIWKGEPAGSVKFGLYDGNSKVDELELNTEDAQATSQNFWSGKFKNDHPVRNLNGEVIKYEVKELENNQPVEKEVRLGNRTYKVEIRPAENNVFNFTNTDITKGDVQIIKTWVGTVGQAKFGLFKNGNEIIPNIKPNLTKTSVDGQYTVKFENVSLTDEEGKAVKYEIKELGVNDNILKTDDIVSLDGRKYKVSYDAGGNITNTELIDITVTKKWGVDVPQSEQQSVTVGVFKNAGTDIVKEIELKGDNWTGKFVDLPYVDGGYQVKETKINGVEVNEDLKKLYTIDIDNGTGIKATGEVKVTNNFKLPDAKEGKIKVFKQWTVEPKPITISLFTNEKTPTGNEWRRQDLLVTPNDKERVLEAEFDKPAEGTEFEILETAIGDVALSEDAIKSILNDENNYPTQYKIDDYDVRVHEINDNVFFIKNTNDKLLTEITVIKHWSDRTPAKYIKPVKVQLYVEESDDSLMAVGKPVELSDAGDWTYTFNGLDKKSGEDELKYHIAEVGEGKESVSLAEIKEGYKLGNYNVKIREDLGYVSIANDVNLIDITARKVWNGQAAANTVEFSLYKKTGDKLVFVESKSLNAASNWDAVFEVAGEENNQKIEYQVFETAIDGVNINIDPTVTTSYTTDLTGDISYTTGTINNGTYAVVITKDEASGVITVRNTYKPNPVVPVIPGGDTPVVPVNPPVDPTPNPTPNPTTPTIIVPDDSTPQGPSSPGNNSGEDGNTNGDEDDDDDGFEEIDEDEVPQDGNIDNTDDADDADDNNEEETTDIADNKAPKGTPKLPKTGGETGDFLSIIGLGLIGLGLVIRRRR